MREMQVRGEMAAVGLRNGSSGRFSGDIEGLYEGYRVGNPPEQHRTLEVANGAIALILRHQMAHGRERGENPFANGNDPFENPPGLGGPPSWMTGGPPGGGPPPWMQGEGGPPPFAAGAAGMPPFEAIKEQMIRAGKKTKVTLQIDGEHSTGIFAGASGEIEVDAPQHKDAGYLVVNTKDGDLRLDFLEWAEGGNLVADLWVNPAHSTGMYKNAQGQFQFSLEIFPGGIAKGPYAGTLFLETAETGS